MKKFLIYIILYSFFTSCTNDVGKIEPAQESSSQSDTCSQNISYSMQIVPIINSSCAIPTCHVSSGYKDFSNYNLLKTTIDAGSNYFISRIKPGGGMPPSYSPNPNSLSACDISKIESWIKNGYLNN